VSAPAPDPPSTLKAAEEKFSAFLTSQNYPAKVCWIALRDLLVDKKTHFWIKPRPDAEEYAAQQYEEARRWIKEDVPAGRTAKAHLAIARRLFHPVDHLVSEMERGQNKAVRVGQ
jgi:hypothetical protein